MGESSGRAVLVGACLATLAGCSQMSSASGSVGTGEGTGGDPGSSVGSRESPPSTPSTGEDESAPPEEGTPRTSSGELTAGAWDDNLNFSWFSAYREQELDLAGRAPFTDDEHRAAHDRFPAARSANQRLDIALVLDTTGSMGDEISYLQKEFQAIAQQIDALFPSAEQRWALIVYRDEGDAYAVTPEGFFGATGDFSAALGGYSAGGGGDYPEATHLALAALLQLGWRDGDDVARLAFWVADAPHHEQFAGALADAVRSAADSRIRLYPVAASGVDELTELTMRSAAQLTGGRYLFLTDDSGIGGDHKNPTLPCYFVTRLSDAIVRMVRIEMTGAYEEPAPEQILRTGGDPANGACALDDEQSVLIF